MTDNLYEFRKLVLRDLNKEGYKYIARDKNGELFTYANKPTKREKAWVYDGAYETYAYQKISIVSHVFTDIEWEDGEPFRIPYTNWKEVPVDTPVVYTNVNGEKFVRYFCKYDEDNDRVVLYAYGRTSLTEQGIVETHPERVTIYKQGEKLKNDNDSDDR